MSDWIDDFIEKQRESTLTDRDEVRHNFIEWLETYIKAGYTEAEISGIFLKSFYGYTLFYVYALWMKEYFDDMKEPA